VAGRSLRGAVLDLVGVWRDTRLIVLVAQTAAVYAAILPLSLNRGGQSPL